METKLIKYDAACKALSEAKSVDEVKSIRDKSIAIQIYARQAKNKELELDATEIRMRAERRLGELLKATKKNVGVKGSKVTGSKKVPVKDDTPTLADMGITKKLSSRAQKLADVSEEKFESALGEWRERVQEDKERMTSDLLGEKAHVSHATGNNEWNTPIKYIEAARLAMGSIDTDPASSKIANQNVKAKLFFTADDNGLKKKWVGNVWMNPPYAQPLMSDFAEAIASKFEKGEIDQACVLVNNATETAWFQRIAKVASIICFPSGRIAFLDQDGKATGAPLQGQAILYLGSSHESFIKAFEGFGLILWKEE